MGNKFEIVDPRNVFLFDPNKIGVQCYSTSTANRKGYHCEYAVNNGEFYLTRLSMTATETNKDLASLHFLTKESNDYKVRVDWSDSEGRRIFELLIRSDHFYAKESGFKIQNSFLIAKDRRHPPILTAARDDFPWNYKTIYLVKFIENCLISVDNYSNELYQFLRLFTADGVLEEKYRIHASNFLTENLGVKFDHYFRIVS